jgi:hypothetical protein
VHPIVLALYEQDLDERSDCPEACDNDMVFIALRGATAARPSALATSTRSSSASPGRRAPGTSTRTGSATSRPSEHLASGTSRDKAHPKPASLIIRCDALI